MSKELTPLEALERYGYHYVNGKKDYKIIEKSLKALEIIKNKEVNVQNFKVNCSTMSYKQYLFMWKDIRFIGFMLTSKAMLTKKEYKLLKEVLL